MTDRKPLSFDEIRKQADDLVYLLQPTIDKLEAHPNFSEMIGCPEVDRLEELQATLKGISVVLDVIGRACNASINRDGLDAFQEVMKDAEESIAHHANRSPEFYRTDDEIAF